MNFKHYAKILGVGLADLIFETNIKASTIPRNATNLTIII
tara:strand:- start:387 stop:506 length:120 start_codon:yes stop_codon:yes gene_type:complete